MKRRPKMHIDPEYYPEFIKKPLKKIPCAWAKKTNWAWGFWHERKGRYLCTCVECKPPKRLKEV